MIEQYSSCSEQIGQLALALSKAQGAYLTAEKICENPHFKSKYAPLIELRKATQKALSANELAIIQKVMTLKDYVAVESKLSHSSGQWEKTILILKPDKFNIHGFGSAMSYAKRYSYKGLVGIDDGESDDDGNGAITPPKEKQKPIDNPLDQNKIYDYKIPEHRQLLSKIFKYHGISDTKYMKEISDTLMQDKINIANVGNYVDDCINMTKQEEMPTTYKALAPPDIHQF